MRLPLASPHGGPSTGSETPLFSLEVLRGWVQVSPHTHTQPSSPFLPLVLVLVVLLAHHFHPPSPPSTFLQDANRDPSPANLRGVAERAWDTISGGRPGGSWVCPDAACAHLVPQAKGDLRDHVFRVHLPVMVFRCETCGSEFTSWYARQSHGRKDHGQA